LLQGAMEDEVCTTLCNKLKVSVSPFIIKKKCIKRNVDV